MRVCATCAEMEQLLERAAADHWNVLHRCGEVESEQAATVEQLLLTTKAALDEAREQYKSHLETVHSIADSKE
jgi:hypothetical protein